MHNPQSATRSPRFLLFLISSVSAVLLLVGCHQEQQVAWQWTLKGQCYAEPLVDGATVYAVTDAGEIIAGDSRTGKILWQKQLEQQSIVSEPALKGDRLFVASRQGNVYAFESKTGAELWRRSVPDDGFQAPLSVAADLLLLPSTSGTVYAISQSDGKTAWLHKGNLKYNTRAVVHDGGIFIGGWSNSFFRLGLDGRQLWRFSPGRGGFAREAVVDENRVYIPSRDNHVYALEASTGKLLWRFPALDPSNLLTVKQQQQQQDRITFADLTGRFVSLDARTGAPVSEWNTGKPFFPLYAFGDDCMAVADHVYMLEPNHKRMKIVEVPFAASVLVLAFAPERLIIVPRGKLLFALTWPKKVT